MSATTTSAPWFRRDPLRRLVRDVLGWTEEDWEREYPATREQRVIEWYEAEDRTALFDEYAEDWYAFVCAECFCDYTAAAVRRFAGWWRDRAGVVLDLGGGIGASTRLFEELTGTECVFHAYGDGSQLRVARELVGPSTVAVGGDEESILRELAPTAVMAFELFEHVREPLALLRTIDAAGVDVLCCANSFGAVDFGHWPSYLVDGEEVRRDRIARWFGAELRSRGWLPEQTGFWNSRPAIWVRRQPALAS